MSLFNKNKKQQKNDVVTSQIVAGETWQSSTDRSSYYENLYDSKPIRDCVRIIVEEAIKCEPKHYLNSDSMNSNIQAVLNVPCESMDFTQFISVVTGQFLIKNNAYIMKYYDHKGNVTKLLPIIPQEVIRKEYNGKAVYQITIADDSGKLQRTFEVYEEDVIHLKRDVTTRRFFGGQGNYRDEEELKEYATAYKKLHETLQRSTTLMPAVALEVIPGVSDADQIALADKFVNTLTTKGYAITNQKFKVTENKIETKAKQNVTIEQIKFYEQVVCDHFKVPISILHGTGTKEDYQNFLNLTIKPIMKIFSDVFTNAFFTFNERRAGHRIQFYDSDLFLMSIGEKREWLRDTNGMALMTINEQRRLIGLPPVEGGDRILQSLNNADVKIVNDYQMSKSKDSKKELKTDE